MELSLLVLCHLFFFAIQNNYATDIITRFMTGQPGANLTVSKFAAKVGHPGEDCLDCCY
jgi:hypothetical protein